MDFHSRAKMLLVPNVKQAQREISRVVDSVLASDPKRSLEEVQRAVTLQILGPALERLLVTTEEKSNKEGDTAFLDLRLEASQRVQRIFANRERLGLIVAKHGTYISL